MLRGIGFSAIMLVIGAGCASTGTAVDSEGTAPPGWLTQGSPVPGVIVVPSNGSYPPDTTVECGGPPTFLAGALDDPPLLADTEPAQGALEPLVDFLGSGEGDHWPQDGYWVLTNDERSLLLAHIADDGTATLLGTRRDGSDWTVTQISSGISCPIRVPLPDGLGDVEWRIDPEQPANPLSAELHLLAIGHSCSSGQPMNDRLATPQLFETRDAIYIALVAFRPTGDQTCPGNPEEAVTIALDQAIGDRSILNARTAAGTLSDYLPVSPCGHIDRITLPEPEPTNGPIALDGPRTRTAC